MPRRTRKSAAGSPRAVLLFIAATLALLAAGEILLLSRQDSWKLAAGKLGLGDPAQVTRIVGQRIREGLSAAAIPGDSVRIDESGEGRVSLRAGVPAHASLLQVNHAITRTVEKAGLAVLAGRERIGAQGETVVRLEIGLPRRPTHEVVLVSQASTPQVARDADARVALVLFGFAEDELAEARALFAQPQPFAVALPAGAAGSAALFRAAREREREVVLHLPLEPLNFPQVNPGAGTILVTMKPPKISGLVRRYLDQAGPVTAVANHMGSLATQDMTVMRAVYQELRRRGIPFLHVTPAAGSVCKPLAADLGVEYAQPDAVIDAEAQGKDAAALERRWTEVLSAARRRGRMVVLLRATPRSRTWLAGALSRRRLAGVSVVPLESMIGRPAAL